MIDRSRFPATFHLTSFWALVPSWIETEDAASTRVLPTGAAQHELEHWTWTHRVWNGWQNPAFVQKRIADMTDAEFSRWCRANRTSYAAWHAWVCS